MKTILLTGAAGLVGGAVIRRFKDSNVCFVAVDNMSTGDFRNLIDLKGIFLYFNVSKITNYKYYRFDAIIHLAADTNTLSPDINHLKSSIEESRHIFNIARTNKIPILFASSAAVYGAGTEFNEDSPTVPLNAYGLSKLLLERELLDLKIPNTCICRFFNVYGGFEKNKGKSASMIYQLIKQAENDKKFVLFKSGEQRRDFVYVDDVAEFIWKWVYQADYKDCPTGIFNLGSGESASFNQICHYIKPSTNIEYIDNRNPELYQNFTQANITKAAQFGYSPRSIEKGVSDYMAFLKDNGL